MWPSSQQAFFSDAGRCWSNRYSPGVSLGPMFEPWRVHPDITVVPTYNEVPGVGMLAINTFVLHAEQTMIVDCGTSANVEATLTAIDSVVDPDTLQWLWITHTDADHIGAVGRLLDRYPALSVITTFTGFVKMGTHAPLPPKRVRLVNPGETIDLGDRTVTAVVPPLFDAPETTGFHDPVSGVLFSSDCFGAILPTGCRDTVGLDDAELLAAQTLWTSIDTPWVNKIDRAVLDDELTRLQGLDLSMILSAHLPASTGIVRQQLDGVRAAPDALPFVGPTLESMMQVLR